MPLLRPPLELIVSAHNPTSVGVFKRRSVAAAAADGEAVALGRTTQIDDSEGESLRDTLAPELPSSSLLETAASEVGSSSVMERQQDLCLQSICS